MDTPRFFVFPPRPKPTGRTVCSVCACLIDADLKDRHLLVCPVVHPEKKDK